MEADPSEMLEKSNLTILPGLGSDVPMLSGLKEVRFIATIHFWDNSPRTCQDSLRISNNSDSC
jgi:hypothetical protein